MKNLLITFIISLLAFSVNAQINVVTSTNGSLTILPSGLRSKLPSGTFSNTNISIGDGALNNNSYSKYNIGIGYNALLTQSFANANVDYYSYNLAVGNDALRNNQPTDAFNANFNTAVGNRTLTNNTIGKHNTALGYVALYFNSTGNNNTAIGSNALYQNSTGTNNSAIGISSLFNNNIGNYNVAMGTSSLYNNEEGNSNIAIGYYAGFNNFNNSRSTAIGYQAMIYADDRAIGINTYNTAIGAEALRGSNTAANNTGTKNTTIGDASMRINTSGSENVAVGVEALKNNDIGDRNTIIGYQAGLNNSKGSGNVFIGYQAGYNNTSGDDNLVIENSNTGQPLIRGDFTNDKVGINRIYADLNSRTETFQVTGEAFKSTGTGNWIIPSDRRLKENIVYLNSQQMLDKVLKMKGVTYNWIDKTRGKDKVFGFIAQDLQQVFPENVKTDKEGFLSASYGAYDPMLVESIKALNEKIEKLEIENKALQSFIQNEVASLKNSISEIPYKNTNSSLSDK